MRVVVTGAAGMLGQDLVEILAARHTVISTDVASGPHPVDIADATAVRAFLEAVRPDAVVHCAALTNVDNCERNPDLAYRVNALGSAAVAGACQAVGAAIACISTDFVFDGEKGSPYTEFDTPNPINTYGASKLAGEQLVRSLCPRHYIVRTQWLYGEHGRNFPQAILNRADAGQPLRVVRDQVGVPTFTRDLSRAILRVLEQPLYGTYHAVNRGEVSWCDFAKRLLELAGMDPERVEPIASSDWPSPARRPAYSVLRPYVLELTDRADVLRPWEAALTEFLSRIDRLAQP